VGDITSHLKIKMLLGEYTHTLDDKNRLTLPVKFKSELGKKIVVTRGLDSSLFIYSQKEWKIITEKLSSLSMTHGDSRGFSRFFLAGAAEVELDKSGRILVPEHLKGFAKLSKEVVLAGVQSRVELWDAKAWASYKHKMERDGDLMAEKLGEVGII
jgi:MraZ protein